MKQFSILFITLVACNCTPSHSPKIIGQSKVVRLHIDLTSTNGPMDPVWAWFGYDEPNYTYMKNGKNLLSEIADFSPVPVYVRTHNLLTSGDGTPALKWGSTNVYREDKWGNPVYDWSIIDSIFDTYVDRGMKPLVEIGFMPEALSVDPVPYKHNWKPGAKYEEIFTGWAYPPKDYGKWSELIFQWVRHSIERYGVDEVNTWFWEVWNEPNIGYWRGTAEEYLKLYDYTAQAVKRALPSARIGGPHSTGPSWDQAAHFLKLFLDHVSKGINYATGERGSPVDFIGFHAKGRPELIDSVVRMNLGTQLRDISRGFEIVASYPELRNLPIIIGESDPEGCAACSVKDNPENAYRNGTLYPSYTAAAFSRKYELADTFRINFAGAVTWAFEFEDHPWFNGYRSLATNGIDKPVLNVFRMFAMMRGKRAKVSGDIAYDLSTVCDSSVRGKRPDISALAAIDSSEATVLVWNYHDLNITGDTNQVVLKINGIPARQATFYHYRIDYDHSNAYSAWLKMGSPQEPDAHQYSELEKAARLEFYQEPGKVRIRNGKIVVNIELPRQGISLLRYTW